ncbi:hypothetical protein MB14_07795 [Roseivirga ehrenbergii]|uniref:Uncharacterized protein n=1 Tax=Roseivirga ehrenbergii (strain DSM 102268 / JCM 13514 / KCTC 12282 / NCIMB 14502 / KMM 6017) TaxID=279360 RepID=A0A150X8M4_ROSEK|nr:hypothetical protein MB14_07795 [Roseivirga ehrenbergii]
MGYTHSCVIPPRWGYKGVAPTGLGLCTSFKLVSALKGHDIKTKGAALRKIYLHPYISPVRTRQKKLNKPITHLQNTQTQNGIMTDFFITKQLLSFAA